MSNEVYDFNIGHSTAYAYAKASGDLPEGMTPEEYGELLASYATVGQTAVTAAQTATTKASEAATSATTATNKASEATTAAQTATTKAGEAVANAEAAARDASQAMAAESMATAKASEATTAAATAVSAKGDAVSANTAAQSAKTAAQTAQTGAEAAAASVSASAEQIATNASDISQLKSEFTALESDGVVPTAEQILTDKGVTDSVPYHYRKTGGDGADREYDEIVGGSLAVNQLVQDGNFPSDTNWTAVNCSISVSENVCAFLASEQSGYVRNKNAYMVNGNKYFRTATLNANNATSITFNVSGVLPISVASSASYQTLTDVINWSYSTGNQHVRITDNRSSGWTNVLIKDVMLIDITAMFGSTIADHIYQLEQTTTGAGVTFFKSLFPNDYYEYNAGELVSVSGLSAHKMVGFNQWDEEWELGGYNTTTGAKENSTINIRSKNYIPVLPNTVYYDKAPNDHWIVQYDANHNRISAGVRDINKTFTTKSNAAYITFYMNASYGTIYNHDICINLSDPTKNGTYEPYKAHSYPLDSTVELRGLFKLDANNNLYADGDTYDADGTVTRKYGIVDLGTLNYNYYAPSTFFYTNITGRASNTNCVCALYTNVGSTGDSAMAGVPDMSMAPMASANGQIKFKNSAYTTTGAFKAAMSGIMLVYELATPTTEEADPYQHLQQCDPNGTEEYVSTGIVPIGHNSFYPENLRAKVEGLPWNFASLIAPTESAFTATRNYTTGSLFIVDNVLYKATANIANGGAITPNTNCAATTLAEIISALA